jgi:hypothetical protein
MSPLFLAVVLGIQPFLVPAASAVDAHHPGKKPALTTTKSKPAPAPKQQPRKPTKAGAADATPMRHG